MELSLAVSEAGAGEPVVCLHSGGFTSRQWKRLASLLASTHRVVLPDLLGYGATGRWPDDAPFEFARDVEAVMRLVRGLGQPVHLVGHSYGGFLAAHVALQAPTRSLSLYEPVTFSVLDPVDDADALAALATVKPDWTPDASGNDEAWFASFVDWWNGAGAWAAMPEDTRASFRAVGQKLQREVASLFADPMGRAGFAPLAKIPTLIMGGARSPMTERRTIERLAQLTGGALEILADAGHMGPITHHAQVNAAIAAHIRGASKR